MAWSQCESQQVSSGQGGSAGSSHLPTCCHTRAVTHMPMSVCDAGTASFNHSYFKE